ncbi:MAG: hypothetical protein ABSC13_06920 [Dehalococcoidia bacterium]|jgi:hypothetical protein
MRDIRKDLKERLESIAVQKRAAENQLARLKETEDMYQALLEDEQLRWKAQQPPLAGLETMRQPKSNGRTPLGRFIMEMLGDGRVWERADLAKLASNRGLIGTDKSPGRVLHFSLVGMAQNGLVEKVGDSSWRLPRLENTGDSEAEENEE